MRNVKLHKKIALTILCVAALGLCTIRCAHAWKFAVCGDTRSGHSDHEKNIEAIINKMPNDTRITVWNAGDVTSDGIDSHWRTWQEIVAPLETDWDKTDPPGYMSPPGNHDSHESGWRERWAQYLPSQVGLSAYPGISGHSQGLYGSVKYDNTLWVWLDSESTPSGQEAFIKDTLILASQDPELTWRFVFFHHPPIACGGGHGDWSKGKTWHNDYFIPYGVDIVFTDHNHMYSRLCSILDAKNKSCDESNRGDVIGDSDGVVHITAGGGGASTKSPDDCSYQEKGAGVHHFLEVEVNGATLNIKTWDTDHGSATDPLLIDDFTIRKDSAPNVRRPAAPRNLRLVVSIQ